MRRALAFSALLGVALLLTACAPVGPVTAPVPAQKAGCRVMTRADVRAFIANNHVAVFASVNERPVRLTVATGMVLPLVLRADFVASHGLPGTGVPNLPIVNVERFSVGSVRPLHFLAPVTESPIDADGLLGWGYLQRFDVEIDPAEGRFRLHEVAGCDDGFVPFAEPYFSLPLHRAANGRPLIPVSLDGVAGLFTVSTGSDMTAVARAAALRAGVSEAELAAASETITTQLLSGEQTNPVHRFRKVEIGEHVLSDVALPVFSSLSTDGELGGDYLLRHRVWISPATGKVYIARGKVDDGR